MQSLLFKIVVLPLIGLFVTILFVFLTFPEDKVQLLVQRQFEAALDYQYRVEAVEFDMGFSGVEMKGITLTPRFELEDEFADAAAAAGGTPTEPVEGEETLADKYFCPTRIDAAPMLIDRIAASPSWSSLIFGDVESTFTVEAAGGTINGELVTGEEEGTRDVTATISTINLARFTWMRNKMGVHLAGILGGEVDLTMGAGGMDSGSIELNMGNLVLCPKTFMMGKPNPIPFTLPVTRFGNLAGTIEVTAPQRLEFKNFESSGEDASLKVSGYVQLANERFPKGNVDIRIKLKPDQRWMQENSLEAALYNMCRRFDDGSIQIVINGQSGETKPDCVRNAPGANNAVPNRTQSRPPANRTATPAPQTPDNGDRKVVEEPVQPDEPRSSKTRAVMGNAQMAPVRPVNADGIRGQVNPVPEGRRRQVLDSMKASPR